MSEMQSLPADENGEVLRRMRASGDDLSMARVIEFAHTLPDQAAAEKLVIQMRALGYEVDAYASDVGCDWEVICGVRMVPVHADVTATEERLGAMATELGGRVDGWSCFEV